MKDGERQGRCFVGRALDESGSANEKRSVIRMRRPEWRAAKISSTRRVKAKLVQQVEPAPRLRREAFQVLKGRVNCIDRLSTGSNCVQRRTQGWARVDRWPPSLGAATLIMGAGSAASSVA